MNVMSYWEDKAIDCEIACVVFDSTRWFNRCAADDSETFQNVAPGQISNGRVERDFLLKRSRINESWDTVKIIRRGKCGICELVSVEGSKPGAALILR